LHSLLLFVATRLAAKSSGVAVVKNIMHTTDKHDLVPLGTLQKVAEWKRFIHEQLKQIRRDQTKEAESRMNKYFSVYETRLNNGHLIK
jgi:hypothetical protein